MEKADIIQIILDNEDAINKYIEQNIVNKTQVYLDAHQAKEMVYSIGINHMEKYVVRQLAVRDLGKH